MAEWSVEPLNRSHERGEFTCGKGPLDNFLRTLVSQYEKRRLGRTYVLIRPGAKRVLGYYTLAAGAVSFENLPAQATKKLLRHPVPVILLARLAVDQSVRGQGLGGFLLADALRRCLSLAEQLGVHAVVVDALDDQAKAFYQHYGFAALRDDPLHLYLPMATIEDAFGAHGGNRAGNS
jgi:GNAT superfamily N-acetyltransferase